MTRECMQDVLLTDYDNYEVILIDNWSTSLEAQELSRNLSSTPRCRVLRVEEPFNFSRLNNLAAGQAEDAEFLVLMNNDVFHSDPAWLEKLVGEALADERVAIVGAKLAYPNGTIQHAAILLGMGGIAGHAHSDKALDDPGYCGRLAVAQEVSAVTAACMLIRASVFREMSGFDEDALAVAFNDVDFCLRVRSAGYKVIWTPDVLAEHRESTSRGADDLSGKRLRFINECNVMKGRWGDGLRSDPYYNPLFDIDGQPFFDLIDPASASLVATASRQNQHGMTRRARRGKRVTSEKGARER
jgi:GT2 family glycosyltransferase